MFEGNGQTLLPDRLVPEVKKTNQINAQNPTSLRVILLTRAYYFKYFLNLKTNSLAGQETCCRKTSQPSVQVNTPSTVKEITQS